MEIMNRGAQQGAEQAEKKMVLLGEKEEKKTDREATTIFYVW